jgi:hypothetical protein
MSGMSAAQLKRLSKQLNGGAVSPKSVCCCGHVGDGPASMHAGIIGHGACTIRGCKCQKFTWSHRTAYGEDLLAKARKARKAKR